MLFLLNFADVCTGVTCKIYNNGFVRKSWTGKLENYPIRFPGEGRIEAKAEPSASDRSHVQVEDGGRGGANPSHIIQVFDRVQRGDSADV